MGYIILGSMGVFLLIFLIRAAMFTPEELPEREVAPVDVNRDKIMQDMVEMIRCKTISGSNWEAVDFSEFEKFYGVLETCYPLIHEKCKMEKIGRTGLLYFLEGKSHDKPVVCMAHYDVVPVEESGWDKPAFDGILEDGVIWGRGTLDTKGTMCGVMEALEHLLASGYVPARDLYLSFSGDEEVGGESCPAIVSYLEERGIKPAFVLDEGGAVVEDVFPGVRGESAMIGICEKGYMDVELSMESNGGHASTPPEHSIVGELSKAVVAIEKHPFKGKRAKAVDEMFDELGRHAGFGMKIIFANMWLFHPILSMVSPKLGGEINALMRTTCATTCMEGSKAYNVLPPKAKVGLNLRLMQGDTVESVLAYLKRVVKNDRITIKTVLGHNPSKTSDTACEEWTYLKQMIHATWPSAIISPYIMLACTDSRHYCRISEHVYRFSPMKLSKEERAMMHGNNERISVDALVQTVEFYVRLLREM